MPRHVKDLSLAHLCAARKDDGTLERDTLTRPRFSDPYLVRFHGVAPLQPSRATSLLVTTTQGAALRTTLVLEKAYPPRTLSERPEGVTSEGGPGRLKGSIKVPFRRFSQGT